MTKNDKDHERTVREHHEFLAAESLERTPDPRGNYSHKRGKLLPTPIKASWGARGGDGQEYIANGKNVLDECLGS